MNKNNDVRKEILKTTLRLVCSYWKRRLVPMSEEHDHHQIRRLVINHDLKTMFDFCKSSIRKMMSMNGEANENNNDTTNSCSVLEKVVEWFELRNI